MTLKYKLLTPGPLTTTATVKEKMLVDHCTWDDDYKQITQDIRSKLLRIAHVDETKYTTVLMQGSGTFGVESVISSVIGTEDTLLILSNGAYGDRITDIAKAHKINHIVYKQDFAKQPDVQEVKEILEQHSEITHLAMVHSETTTGILNDLQPFSELTQAYELTFIVDAMSSFGGVDIDMKELHIDFLISSANKCIQGVPGFSFIIANLQALEESRGNARTLSLDLHDQWDGMKKDGKWRFTSPTHVVLAFEQALKEFEDEGGVEGRHHRYQKNMQLLLSDFSEIGLEAYLSEENQGPIIATFAYPENAKFDFLNMYNFIKDNGYAIYPGKLNGMNTFRIGVIGEIYPEDINELTQIMAKYLWEVIEK
jgi:2-aminoethylphosphonate-pyruvate transaminase